MRVLSLFSGVGGFDLGLERAGFNVIGQAENDPFCNKVLAKHWPEVTRYGDVRDVGLGPAEYHQQGESHDDEAHQSNPARARDVDRGQPDSGSQSIQRLSRGACDLICGGFPCQDLSVAGKRAGLDGARSGLWFEFQRILSELRPAFCLIENVPGLLSSNEGRDFGVILAGLDELGYCIGWAVLDSQHFGVPQRRRRVYIVGGPTRACVQQILSLCESGDWHPAKGREAREDVAYALTAGVRGTGDGHGNAWNSTYVANTLGAHHPRNDLDNETYIPTISPALAARDYRSTREDVAEPAFITHTLRADGFDASEDGTGRGTPLTVIQDARGVRDKPQNGIGIAENADVMYTLDGTSQHAFQQAAAVRRLTPVECERLQGFPDDWTKLDDKTPDGPRYKAMGNAVTVPVIEYLGKRIMAVAS